MKKPEQLLPSLAFLALMAGATPANAQTQPTPETTDVMPDPDYFRELCLGKMPDKLVKTTTKKTAERIEALLTGEFLEYWTYSRAQILLDETQIQLKTMPSIDLTPESTPTPETLLELEEKVEQLRDIKWKLEQMGNNDTAGRTTVTPAKLSPGLIEQTERYNIYHALTHGLWFPKPIKGEKEITRWTSWGECPDSWGLSEFILNQGHFPVNGEWTPEQEIDPLTQSNEAEPLTEEEAEILGLPLTQEDLYKMMLRIDALDKNSLLAKQAELLTEGETLQIWLETNRHPLVATYAAYVANLPGKPKRKD